MSKPAERPRLQALALLVPLLALSGPSLAAPITRTFDFVVTNIQDQTGNHVTPPANPVVGSITVTFDPALGGFSNRTTGIAVNSLNVAVASPVAFSFNPANTDEVQIGGLDQGTGGSTDGVNDFILDIFDAPDATPFFGNLDYTIFATSIATGEFSDFGPASRADGTVTIGTTTTVAEPPTAALYLAGCMLGAAICRRRKRGPGAL
jgi:hypothetical protein